MLYNEHSKAGKELQRKIAKLREDKKDPSLPQRIPSRSATSTPAKSTTPAISSSVTAPASAPSPPPHLNTRLSDSQQMVEESFMLLGQRVRHTRVHSDSGLNPSVIANYRARRTMRSITSGRSLKACSNTCLSLSHSPLLLLHLQRTAHPRRDFVQEIATRSLKILSRKHSTADWTLSRPLAPRCWYGMTQERIRPIQTAVNRGSRRSHQNPSQMIGTTSLKQMVKFTTCMCIERIANAR